MSRWSKAMGEWLRKIALPGSVQRGKRMQSHVKLVGGNKALKLNMNAVRKSDEFKKQVAAVERYSDCKA